MNTQAIAVERAPARTDVGPARKLERRLICRSRDRRAGRGRGQGLTPQLLILGTIALLGAGLLTSRMLPDAIERPGAAFALAMVIVRLSGNGRTRLRIPKSFSIAL